LFLKDIACLGSEADEAGNVFDVSDRKLIFSNISFFFMWKLRFRRFCEAKTPFKALFSVLSNFFISAEKIMTFWLLHEKCDL
jgi:hypothetical protein